MRFCQDRVALEILNSAPGGGIGFRKGKHDEFLLFRQEHDDSCWNLKFALAMYGRRGHQPPSEDMIAAKTPFHPRCLEVGSHNLLPWRLCQDKTVSCFMRRDEFVSFV